MIARVKRFWRTTRGHWWMIRRYGVVTYTQYETLRQVREEETGEKFDPLLHGESMLRSLGATEEQIAEARARGLA